MYNAVSFYVPRNLMYLQYTNSIVRKYEIRMFKIRMFKILAVLLLYGQALEAITQVGTPHSCRWLGN